MTDVFEPSENGPSALPSPVARRMPEVYCPAITDPLKLMYSIPHKNTIFLVPLYLELKAPERLTECWNQLPQRQICI
jgi:hypothetical protein